MQVLSLAGFGNGVKPLRRPPRGRKSSEEKGLAFILCILSVSAMNKWAYRRHGSAREVVCAKQSQSCRAPHAAAEDPIMSNKANFRPSWAGNGIEVGSKPNWMGRDCRPGPRSGRGQTLGGNDAQTAGAEHETILSRRSELSMAKPGRPGTSSASPLALTESAWAEAHISRGSSLVTRGPFLWFLFLWGSAVEHAFSRRGGPRGSYVFCRKVGRGLTIY